MANSEQDLRDALRLSKLVEGLPVRPPAHPPNQLTLTEADIDAIASRVMEVQQDFLLKAAGRLVWEGVRKLVVTGIVALFAIEQIKGWLK